MKTINPSELSPMQVQMILQTAVAPRPIALASTIDKNGNVMFLICIACCFLIAWLLHLVIEKPFMKWRTRFLSGKKLLFEFSKMP